MKYLDRDIIPVKISAANSQQSRRNLNFFWAGSKTLEKDRFHNRKKVFLLSTSFYSLSIYVLDFVLSGSIPAKYRMKLECRFIPLTGMVPPNFRASNFSDEHSFDRICYGRKEIAKHEAEKIRSFFSDMESGRD